ncbi:MAG: hemolysin [Legionella sp. 40-6]|nr:BON domain-containing protein [Legionella sp.]OJY32795.1 MAG: hemolysin [Legionella sp. 40-6]
MIRHGCWFIFSVLLVGCTGSNLWTGANLIYDRHSVYKKLDDYQLILQLNTLLAQDGLFKREKTGIDFAVFNGDVLIVGTVPNASLLQELTYRLKKFQGYRRLFNVVKVNNQASNSVYDSWITAKIRSQIFADASIDPHAFKILTAEGVVYLMGDVWPEQAKKVVTIAQHTAGVVHVVKIFKYLEYQKN